MHWRELRQNQEIFAYLNEIMDVEDGLPRWFRNSSSIWTRDRSAFQQFVTDCQECWGLFVKDKLSAVVYFEQQTRPEHLDIHLSVVNKITPEQFIAQTAILRDQTYRRGVKRVQGWVLQKNKALRDLLRSIGFIDTELRMDRGESHGSVLRWTLMEARRA